MLPAIKTNNSIKNNRRVTNTTEDIKLTANNHTKNSHTKNSHTKKEQYKTELLLALSFGGVAFCTSGLHIHLFTMMKALSIHDALAVLAGSLIGPFQIVSLVMDMFLARRITPILLGTISIILMVCGLLFLLSASIMSSYTALLFAMFFGLGQGLTYIVRGSIPLYLFGDNHYGAITGRINGIRIIMTAIAPFSVALLLDHVEIEWVILLLSLCMAASLWLLVYLRNQQNVGVVQT